MLMTGSATRLRHLSLCVSVRISHELRRLQRQVSINQPQKFLPLLQKMKDQFMLSAASVRVNSLSGVVLYVRKRPQLNELSSPRKIGCVLLACNLTTCSENALKPKNALSLFVEAPITSCCTVLRKFSA